MDLRRRGEGAPNSPEQHSMYFLSTFADTQNLPILEPCLGEEAKHTGVTFKLGVFFFFRLCSVKMQNFCAIEVLH